MIPVSESTKRSFDLAKRLRVPREPEWQMVIDLAMPEAASFTGELDGVPPRRQVYDGTGIVGVEEMSSRLFSGIMPDGIEWAKFEGAQRLNDATLAGIAAVQSEVFRVLSRSNLAAEACDAFKDLAGLGNCCLRIAPGPWDQPIQFQAFSLADFWLTPGPHGRWADLHVRHRLPLYAVKAQWPGAQLPKSYADLGDDRIVGVIESWVRDLASTEERWMAEVHMDGTCQILAPQEHRGQGACHYIVGRWTKSAGALYAKGQGERALSWMEVANDIVRQQLLHAEMALTGMWQADDDGVLNPWAVKLVPGAIIPKSPGSKGLEPLTLPQVRMDTAGMALEEERHNIRKTLYNEQLGPREGTPPTLGEIEQRMAELARAIGPAYSRVWQEFAVPLLVRVLRIMKDQGSIAFPAVDGQTVRLVPASSLVRAALAGQVQKIERWVQGIGAVYGPQAVAALVPVDRYARKTAELLDIPADLPLSPDEQAAQTQAVGDVLAQAGQAGEQGMAALAPVLAAAAGGTP